MVVLFTRDIACYKPKANLSSCNIFSMAAEPKTVSSNYPMSLQFDLDEALTWEDNSNSTLLNSNININIAAPNPNSNSFMILENMPTPPAAAAVDDVCAVCMEGLQSGSDDEKEDDQNQNHKGKLVPCGHVYHATCLASWLFVCNSCPLCRSTIHLK